MIDLGEHVAGGLDQQAARGCGAHPAAGPGEQGRSQSVFDLAQLMADRRLRDVQPLGCASNALRARDLGDQAQVPRIQKI